MTRQNRSKLVTFLVAGLGAIFAEHLLKPHIKRGLKL